MWEELTDAQRTVIASVVYKTFKFKNAILDVTNYTLSLFYIDAKNDTSFKTWEELTDAQRTVIASVVYQYGSENWRCVTNYTLSLFYRVRLNVGGDVTNYMLSLFYIDAKNDTTFKTWEELTDAQRTVVASVVYQYGSQTKTPKFWRFVTNQVKKHYFYTCSLVWE